jgi:hypothetical protein
MPGLAAFQGKKIHFAFRIEEDGLWHCFRFADKERAAKRDAELAGPMMPAPDKYEEWKDWRYDQI